MVWPFKKKEKKEVKEVGEEKIPELPELHELPPLPKTLTLPEKKPEKIRSEKIKTELPSLPPFPVKEKITPKIEPTIKEPPVKVPAIRTIERPRTREIAKEAVPAPVTPRVKEIKPSVRAEPVFVRIDKYQTALQNFQDVKKKVLEIENLLRDIKEIRSREENELRGWEQEISGAKEKLDKIDRTIFKKFEE